jgi:hypothetical protein
MEYCLNAEGIYYKDLDEYKIDIDKAIEEMISKNERLVFAAVAEKVGLTPFTISRYPELRTYVLQKMVYYKEIQVIGQKIDRAVDSLLRSKQTITFISIANKCKFASDMLYRNQYIKDKIRSAIAARN